MVDEADENRALLNAPALGTLMAIRETLDRIEFVETTGTLLLLVVLAALAFVIGRKIG